MKRDAITLENTIVNVVATAALNQEINLNELGKFSYIHYGSNTYGGRAAYFRTSSMKGKISIFSSGKMISMGTTSEEEAIMELRTAKDFLVENGLVTPIALKPTIHNIVVTSNLRRTIDLEAISFLPKMLYEPEQFPACILRINEPYGATVLIFASGKVVLTGLKSSNQIEPTIKKLTSILKTAA